jgi:hypothetical protein
MRGRKTGGRTAGTPNKTSKRVKDFLDRVFARAFTQTVDGATLEDRLVVQIATLTIDPKLLIALIVQVSPPAKHVAHTHTFNLAKLIAGADTDTPDEDDEDEAEADA